MSQRHPGLSIGAPDPFGINSPTSTEVARGLTRIALGWFLLHQGWGKVVQDTTEGLGTFYRGDFFQGRNPAWLPDFIAAPYGYALPWVELIFGVLLTVGLWNRVSAWVSTLIFLSIAVAMLDSGGLLPRHMLMIYVPLGAWIALAGPGRYSLDAWLDGRRAP
ncbi:MAG: DoxX family protein [Gemmatimonadota bacterium]